MGGAGNTVNAIAAYLAQRNAVGITPATGSKSDKNTSASGFDVVFSKMTDSIMSSNTTDTAKQINKALEQVKSTSDTDTSLKAEESKETVIQTDETVNETDTVQETETANTQQTQTDNELQEEMQEMGEELISQITEELDVSEEDIVNAMQVLGLMAVDLLNPENLTALVTEVAGDGQEINLITDSDIYTSLQDLMEGAESMRDELMNEFDLSEQELETAIDEASEKFKNIFLQQEGNEEFAEAVTQEINPQVQLKENANKDVPQSEAFQQEGKEISREPIVNTENQTGQNTNNNKESFGGSEHANLFNQVMNNITEAAMNIDSFDNVAYTDRAQMENIIRQITEKISITKAEDMTSMELQLHPASLGNVNILLTSSKDGIIAKFTAQNEIVKEAVESQMMQLQQKFDEQGIKITSVEVTIESHAFEQNLEQGNERNADQSGESKKRGPLRRINLSELEDEDNERMNEAERISVQMMAASGNSVDFSA